MQSNHVLAKKTIMAYNQQVTITAECDYIHQDSKGNPMVVTI